jgi:hypothetical protein
VPVVSKAHVLLLGRSCQAPDSNAAALCSARMFYNVYLLVFAFFVLVSGVLAAIRFSPPVLVTISSDAEAESNLPVVPDRFFGLSEDHVYGYHGGKHSFDFSKDAGESWSLSDISVVNWGDVGGIAVPMFNDTAVHPSAKRPYAYHDLGLVGVSSCASGWSRQNVTTIGLDVTGQLTARLDSSRTVSFSGVPYPGINSSTSQANPQRMYGMARLDDGIYVTAVAIIWNGLDANPSPDGPIIPWSLVAFSSNDTYQWEYLSIIANISDFKWSTFGPTESDISFLSDRKTLICVIRMDGDANCDTGLYRYFYASRSIDGGHSWSQPSPMQGLGCVRPKLLLLDDGPLLLTGGRLCVDSTKDILLWVSADGSASDWIQFSLTYQHNQLWRGDQRYLFDDLVNSTDAWESLAYTSLVAQSNNRALIFYQKFFTPSWPPWPSATFAMQVEVTRD